VKEKETYHSPFTIQIRPDFLLEGGFIHVSGAHSDTESNGLLLGLTGNILPNGDARVDATTLLEKSSNSSARTFGSNKDDINIRRWDNSGIVLVDDRETVREVQCFAFGNQGSQLGPSLRLGSIRQQVHDDCTPVDSLFNREQGFSRNLEENVSDDGILGYYNERNVHPTIFHCLLPTLTTFPNTNYDIQSIVTSI
jgi:hypothetical protein